MATSSSSTATYTTGDITGYDSDGNPIIGDSNTSTSVTVTGTTSSTSSSDGGWGWGLTYGGVYGGGLGPNWSFGGAGAVLAGNFHCGGQSAIGWSASAGDFAAGKGPHTSYPTNNSRVPNFAVGVIGGRGPGMFATNTGDPAKLSGAFNSTIITIPFSFTLTGLQIEFDYSSGTGVLSVSPGWGVGVINLQTNTFKTAGGVAGCGSH